MSNASKPSMALTARSLLFSGLMAVAVYFVTDQLLFALVVVGVAGAIAIASHLRPRMLDSRKANGINALTWLKELLIDDRLSVRFFSLFSLTAFIFAASWAFSYLLLPEGVVRVSRAEVLTVQVAGSLLGEMVRILAWNLTLPLAVILGCNILLQIHGLPLGYLMPVLWGLFYGLVIGTNSFAIAMAERMAPSLAVLERAGPYEFAGYCLIAVGTYSLARFRFTDFLAGEIRRVDTGILDEIGREDWMALLFGILVVIAAAWREAVMILEVV